MSSSNSVQWRRLGAEGAAIVFSILHGRILGVVTDEFDVEEVRAYPIPSVLGDPR